MKEVVKKFVLNNIEITKGFSGIAAQGALWNISFAGVNKVVTLVGQLALAWLLTPKDMGLVGMTDAMAAFTLFISAGSIGDVLIQRNKLLLEEGQGLWLSLLLSTITVSLIALMSLLAKCFGRDDLCNLLLVLVLPVLAGFANTVLMAKLKQNLEFKSLAISQLVQGVTYTVVSIILAWCGYGPYSLIISRIPSCLIAACYMIFKIGWPSFVAPRWDVIKNLFNPTISLSITGMFMGLQTQAPVFVVGLLLSSILTGYFSWGWAVAGQAVYLLATNLRQVLIPIFVKMGNDFNRQGIAALRAARVMTAILSIACGLQALWIKPILVYILPTKWLPAEPVIVWISLGLIFEGIWISTTAWLNAVGKYKELLYSSILNVLFISLPTALGAWFGGPEKAAMGSAVGMLIGSCVPLAYIKNNIRTEQIKPLLTPLVVTGMTWFFIFYLVQQRSLFWLLLAGIIYILIGLLIWRKQLLEIVPFIKGKFKSI